MQQYAEHFVYALFLCELSWAMDAVPFRRFSIEWEFTCVDDLADAALLGPLAADFVTWSLQLRRHERSRYQIADFMQQRKRVQLGFTRPFFYNTSTQETFNLWRLMHARCLPRTERPLGARSRKKACPTGIGILRRGHTIVQLPGFLGRPLQQMLEHLLRRPRLGPVAFGLLGGPASPAGPTPSPAPPPTPRPVSRPPMTPRWSHPPSPGLEGPPSPGLPMSRRRRAATACTWLLWPGPGAVALELQVTERLVTAILTPSVISWFSLQ